jgi:hypothetical protein
MGVSCFLIPWVFGFPLGAYRESSHLPHVAIADMSRRPHLSRQPGFRVSIPGHRYGHGYARTTNMRLKPIVGVGGQHPQITEKAGMGARRFASGHHWQCQCIGDATLLVKLEPRDALGLPGGDLVCAL